MKKSTRILQIAALASLSGLASIQAQTPLLGDHSVTGNLTVEGTGGLTVDYDLQVNGSQFWLGTWTSPNPDVNTLLIQTDSVLNPAEIKFSALPTDAKFIWEKNANATAAQLMQLSENGVLTLYNPANSDTIVLDTTSGGSLTVNGSEVVTQSPSGVIDVDGNLTFNDSTFSANLYADNDTVLGNNDGSPQATGDVLASDTSLKIGRIGLGVPPTLAGVGGWADYPGLFGDGKTISFWGFQDASDDYEEYLRITLGTYQSGAYQTPSIAFLNTDHFSVRKFSTAQKHSLYLKNDGTNSQFAFRWDEAVNPTIEEDFWINSDAKISGKLTVTNSIEAQSNTSVTAPAVITNFKVEDNGVIWAGEGADFDSTYQIPTGTGDRFMWIPEKGAIRFGGHELLTDVWDYTNIGDHSVSWGVDNKSAARYSTTWGYHNEATNAGATAWGRYGEATGSHATSWGRHTDAYGDYSTAWGNFTDALGAYATSWGHYTKAESTYSTALGQYNVGGVDSLNNGETVWLDLDPVLEVGIGDDNLNRSNALTILKNGQTTLENKFWDDANPTTVPVDVNASEGRALVVEGHAEFEGNITLQDGTVINGADDLQDAVLVSIGGSSLISADSSDRVAIGDGHTVTGTDAIAWGDSNVADKTRSTAWGFSNEATGSGSTAWGYNTEATNNQATAWGDNTAANGISATAWNNRTIASGDDSTAWGYYSTASGLRSTAWGGRSIAESSYSTALGLFNEGGFITIDDGDDTNDGDTQWFELDPLFEIGNGVDNANRSNALTVLKNGQTTLENKHWDNANPTTVPVDANASGGRALVVEGHAEFEGNITLQDGTVINGADDLQDATQLVDSLGNPVASVDGSGNLTIDIDSTVTFGGPVLANDSLQIGNASAIDEVTAANLVELSELLAFPDTGAQDWVTNLYGSNVYVAGVGADSSNNRYIAGSFKDNLVVGDTILTNAGHTDIFVIKLDANGTILWAVSFGDNSMDIADAISVSSNGTLAIAGHFSSANLEIVPGQVLPRPGGSGFEVFVARLDSSNGAPIWAQSFGGNDTELPEYISVNDSGAVTVAGDFKSDSLQIGTDTLVNTDVSTENIFVARMAASDGAPVWAKSFASNNSTYDFSGGLSTNTSGDVFVAGYFRGTSIDIGSITLNAVSRTDIFVARLDGSNGSTIWAESYSGADSFEYPYALTLDNNGDVLIGGRFGGPDLVFGSTTLIRTGSFDVFVALLSAGTGAPIWAKSFPGNGDDRATALSVASSGEVIVGGYYSGSAVPLEIVPGEPLQNAGSTDIFVAGLNGSTGAPIWARSFGDSKGDLLTSLVVAPDNKISITTLTGSAVNFGSQVGFDASLYTFDSNWLQSYSPSVPSQTGLSIYGSSADGNNAIALGARSLAEGDNSLALGSDNVAVGDNATALGANTKANSYLSTVLGRYNSGDFDAANNGDTAWVELDSLFEIGNGVNENDRTNAVTVLKNGQTTLENRYWDALDPFTIPSDADASEGQALVVNGHSQLNGNVGIGPNADGSRPLMVEATIDGVPAAKFSANSSNAHVIEVNTTKVDGGQADIMFMQNSVQRASILHRGNQFEIWTNVDGVGGSWKNNVAFYEDGRTLFRGRFDDPANADSMETITVNQGYIRSSAGLKTPNGSVDTKDLNVTGDADFGGSIILADGTPINSKDDLQNAVLDSSTSTGVHVLTQDSTNNADWGTNSTTALGSSSTVWGDGNTVESSHSTAWGLETTAKGQRSTAWGHRSEAQTANSTAWGYFGKAIGSNSTAWGFWTIAESFLSTAIGRYNVGGVDAGNSGSALWVELDPLFEIGIGTSTTERANAVTVLKNGQTTLENKYWFDAVDTNDNGIIDAGEDPATIPGDPDGAIAGNQSSEGRALVVNGHAEVGGNLTVNGSVTIAHIPAQGGLSMGDYGGGL
ncbi:hypothetical protein [Rubellicoccus peritrichatus]|uniref:Trimeric autotransporter adhesin YadA-like head domain-containing protein n=1 Tax=Rubellicoccus peritrichatus TaxID=3080537 RepID=A0AAQ3LHK2_9BACT|nr:hypothetical protein [Puniceicoccus sp. CR14]WOO42199.1 hypothetical protein RZN69_03795 [Puniceicoccus sp. CR14]